jgi:hypothetical protein
LIILLKRTFDFADKELFHLKVLSDGDGKGELAADPRRHTGQQQTTKYLNITDGLELSLRSS